ncbi:MAG: ribosome small subunit-dependent GTPase A [Acidimicrobiia bacterium]|nr:ribosome small subunit-dependent GTPase A [Acidimicrobiia bacterium]
MNRSELVHFGWDADWEAQFAASGLEGTPGRISRVERGECDVITAEGIVRAQSDSQRAQSSMAPVTGDWVEVVTDDDGDWRITTVLPRRTELVRRDPGEREEQQPLSANVDVVFLVHGFDRPFRAGKLERFLVLAWNAGATPVVILTKADVSTSDEAGELVAIVEAVAPGVEVIVSSIETREGLDRIRELLAPNRSGTLLGESGAGKSSLVNALLDDEVQETKPVRSGDAKGRHTTITRDLLRLPSGGLLIDTPGVRAVGLWDAEDALQQVFSDITEAAGNCRFNDCAHGVEPGCAVAAAVESGAIDPLRLPRYRAMAEELAESEQRLVERKRSSEKRRPSGRRRR